MPLIYKASRKKPKKKTKKKKPSPKVRSNRFNTEEIVKRELGDWTKNPLAAFSVFPKKVRFETQEVKEEIILLLRRHWVTNLPWTLTGLFMFFIPLAISSFQVLSFMPPEFRLMTVIIWYMIILAYVLESFLTWYFNVYFITDERLVDVDFYSLIYKRVSETKIDRIQDVSYSQGGIIQAMFNFGTVHIQTAGKMPEFAFEDVPKPARITKVLNQLVMQEEQEKLEGRVN